MSRSCLGAHLTTFIEFWRSFVGVIETGQEWYLLRSADI
ncbi:hypothetical protein OESDEN_06142 [Oesophagostomum dentatum]|uniref:Uncharacterized protein n=1 Tax=Oesophagostomum dentatum TaxID=61180 RepID=A0A0B1T9L2_OESDE|nr:hypothetical protein OESDEN_06142 [Oesophagostomum dentatum]